MESRLPSASLPRLDMPLVLLITALVLFHGLEIHRLVNKSNCFDELPYIAQGQLHLREGRFDVSRRMHPPLAKYISALPLAFSRIPIPKLNQQNAYQYGFEYLYQNDRSPLYILLASRLPMLFLPTLLAIVAFIWIRNLADPWTALMLALLLLFEPNIMAHSGIVMLDLCLTVMIFTAAAFMWAFIRSNNHHWLWAAGLMFGLSLLSKSTAFLALPVFVTALYMNTEGPFVRRLTRVIRPLTVLVGISFAIVVIGYRVTGLPYWFLDIYDRFIQTVDTNKAVVFYGQAGISRSAHPAHYLAKVFYKCSLPWLALFVWGLIRIHRQSIKLRVLTLGMILVFLIPTMFSASQSAVRYILPAFPFVLLMIGPLPMVRQKWVLATLLLFQGVEVARTHPHYLPYTNEFYQSRGIPIFSGSEYDFGQDLPALKSFSDRHPESVLTLCYFGYADPRAYGIQAQILPSYPALNVENLPHINPISPPQEFLVMSVTSLQGHKDRDLFRWVGRLPPVARLGKTLWVWDITGNRAVHSLLKEWYQRYQWTAHIQREEKVLSTLPL